MIASRKATKRIYDIYSNLNTVAIIKRVYWHLQVDKLHIYNICEPCVDFILTLNLYFKIKLTNLSHIDIY